MHNSIKCSISVTIFINPLVVVLCQGDRMGTATIPTVSLAGGGCDTLHLLGLKKTVSPAVHSFSAAIMPDRSIVQGRTSL